MFTSVCKRVAIQATNAATTIPFQAVTCTRRLFSSATVVEKDFGSPLDAFDEITGKGLGIYHPLGKPITSIQGILDVTGKNFDCENMGKSRFPLIISSYYAGLLDPEKSPLYKIVVPSPEEMSGYETKQEDWLMDVSGEATNWKAGGVQHKYKPVALVMVSNKCASLCRFCFRKRMFISKFENANERDVFPNEKAINYLKKQKNMNDILFSGGDALMINNKQVKKILDIMASPDFDHIQMIRWGTKTLSFLPSRIDEELATMFSDFQNKTGKRVMVATHFDHPDEISEGTLEATDILRSHKIGMFNQSVFMKGINDDPDTLVELSIKMNKCGVRPYYLYQCRPVVGNEHFCIPLRESVKIYREAMSRIGGVLKPRYIMTNSWGKNEVFGFLPDQPDILVGRRHSSKDPSRTGELWTYDVRENEYFCIR